MDQRERLEGRIALSYNSIGNYIENPQTELYTLEPEEQLDILTAIQHHFELVQSHVRLDHSEHSAPFMEAHADVNYWKNKVMNAKAKIRLKISDKERGL